MSVSAANLLQDSINRCRPGNPVNALHIDYKLREASRTYQGQHHLTKTTAY